MKAEFQFAVYDRETSMQKRTTYRVVKTNVGYAIERYESDIHFWTTIFNKQFNDIDELFASKQFKSLFTKNLED